MKELWADIPGWNGFYQVSTLGNVRTCIKLGGYSNRYIVSSWRFIKACRKRGRTELSIRPIGCSKKVYMLLHRLMWEVFKGPIPSGKTIDHINRNPYDNRLENLRIATTQEQARNRNKETGKVYSKYKGVSCQKSYPKKPWVAKIFVDSKCIYLGHFKTEEEAARVYDAEASSRFGEFAKLNFEGLTSSLN